MPARRLAAAALIAAAAFLLVWLTRPAAPPQLVQLTGPTMGSTYAISYHGKGAPAAAQMQREVQAILDEIDAAVSTYRDDSALARFNAASEAPEGTCMDMPQAAIDLAQYALTLSQQSGGAFDATLLPALQAWGFHRKTPSLPAPAPDEAQLAALRQRTGMTHLRVQGQQLCKDAPIHVEFNAIAAGYAIDRIATRFEQLGVRDHLIEVTGEIRGSGTRPDGTPWRVGIEAPQDGARQAQRIVPLSGMALSTSGSYRNWRTTADGQRRGHILDARTLTPVQHRLASVTVAAPLAMHADGLSTLLMALGEAQGFAWAAERDIAALFVIPAGESSGGGNGGDNPAFTLRATPAFERAFGAPTTTGEKP